MRRRALPVLIAGFACAVVVAGCGEETSSSAPKGTTKAQSEKPPPPPEPEGIGDGTHRIPNDMAAGTYRSEGEGSCYWARLAGFSQELDDIIANGNNAPEIVTVKKKDAGFETRGCGDWVPVKDTAPAAPASKFGDGTYQVGVHIKPGTYRADGSGSCYWAK